ncbi:hypothetical protein GOODEAATRI_012996 [Goodea atripinnis]|uniref:Uncharacterized protein n=1 Tax=Goodea atripinnis TaxID=208336 RepID=A0ABV0N0Z4_9TELE
MVRKKISKSPKPSVFSSLGGCSLCPSLLPPGPDQTQSSLRPVMLLAFKINHSKNLQKKHFLVCSLSGPVSDFIFTAVPAHFCMQGGKIQRPAVFPAGGLNQSSQDTGMCHITFGSTSFTCHTRFTHQSSKL